ncbi:MAG: orotate phosphoribosyltransferase [Calditrichia bacterium]
MNNEIIQMFKASGALLEGHFLLTSGLHSPQYFQCALVLQYPNYAETLCRHIVDFFKNDKIDVVIAPAVGGIVVAQEVGRQLGKKTIFAERKDGTMTLRRGFQINKGEKVLVTEDVVTTGGSVFEVIDLVKAHGGIPVGVGCIVDRSNGKVTFGVKQTAVLTVEAITYQPDSCPLCKEGKPAVKPGSRGLQNG